MAAKVVKIGPLVGSHMKQFECQVRVVQDEMSYFMGELLLCHLRHNLNKDLVEIL